MLVAERLLHGSKELRKVFRWMILTIDKVKLTSNEWWKVKLVFHGEQVSRSIDGILWSKTLTRANGNAGERPLPWIQNGGEKGIEMDDVNVHANSFTSS